MKNKILKLCEFCSNEMFLNPCEIKNGRKYCCKECADKDQKAINNGYKIFIVWENDFNYNEQETIDKCIDFLIKE